MKFIKVKDLFKIKKGKKVIEVDEIGPIRYIQIDDLRNNNNIKYCNNENKYVYSEVDDIIIAWDGANAGTIGYGLKGAIGSTLAVLSKKNKNFDTEFCGLFLKSKFNYLRDKCTGATIPHISRTSLEELEVPNMPIITQKRIVKILDKSQELINKRKEQIEALDELVKSKFIDMFGNVNINSKGWNITSMDELIDVIGGYAFKSTEFIDKGVPVLKIGNINAGYFKPTNLMFWKKDDKLEKYLIKPDDLVISLTGTVGKDDYGNVCIMGDDYEEYYLNQRNAKLEIKSNELLNKYYLTYLLKVPEIKQRIIGISRGVRQANIANKDILNLEVPNPPIELQKQFAYFVKQVDKLKFEMEKSLKELEDNFNSLMQRAFNGELF